MQYCVVPSCNVRQAMSLAPVDMQQQCFLMSVMRRRCRMHLGAGAIDAEFAKPVSTSLAAWSIPKRVVCHRTFREAGEGERRSYGQREMTSATRLQ